MYQHWLVDWDKYSIQMQDVNNGKLYRNALYYVLIIYSASRTVLRQAGVKYASSRTKNILQVTKKKRESINILNM